MTSLSTTTARWVEPGVLLLALTAIAQNVLSVKASLWTLTHLRYSQINSHPHSRGHEATVIWLTPSHMYTHTCTNMSANTTYSLFPVLDLKNLEPVLSLSLGLSWPTSLLKGFVPHFYPHHSFMKHLFQRVAGSLLCQVCFFVLFFWSLTQRKAKQLWMTACVFSFVNADTSWALRTVRSEDICTGESRFVCVAFVFVSSETWRFSSFIF